MKPTALRLVVFAVLFVLVTAWTKEGQLTYVPLYNY